MNGVSIYYNIFNFYSDDDRENVSCALHVLMTSDEMYCMIYVVTGVSCLSRRSDKHKHTYFLSFKHPTARAWP